MSILQFKVQFLRYQLKQQAQMHSIQSTSGSVSMRAYNFAILKIAVRNKLYMNMLNINIEYNIKLKLGVCTLETRKSIAILQSL